LSLVELNFHLAPFRVSTLATNDWLITFGVTSLPENVCKCCHYANMMLYQLISCNSTRMLFVYGWANI